MKFLEKNPMIMIVVGILGISMSAIFVRLSDAPSVVTAAARLLWTVVMLTPAVFFRRENRKELQSVGGRMFLLCIISGIFLAVHFVLWFESLQHTSVASSTAIVCTEVIWVSIGYCLFLKGKLSGKAIGCIGITLLGSVLIAFSDSSAGGGQLYGDILSLLAAIAVAVYTLIGREARKTMSTTIYTYIVYVACSVTLAGMTLLQGYGVADFGTRALLVGFLLALFSTILGHSIFSWCLKYFSPSFVSASKLCEPVVAAAMAVFLFREIPDVMKVVGGAIVIGGVFLYSKIEE